MSYNRTAKWFICLRRVDSHGSQGNCRDTHKNTREVTQHAVTRTTVALHCLRAELKMHESSQVTWPRSHVTGIYSASRLTCGNVVIYLVNGMINLAGLWQGFFDVAIAKHVSAIDNVHSLGQVIYNHLWPLLAVQYNTIGRRYSYLTNGKFGRVATLQAKSLILPDITTHQPLASLN